jgi:hypothetical protein
MSGEAAPLIENKDKSFQGSIVCGEGFVLDANEANRLLASNSSNADVILPYLTGDDINSRVDQSPSRFVINFFDWGEERCSAQYPECYSLLEQRVKPERTRVDEQGSFVLRKPLPQKWWIYSDKRPKLYRTIQALKRVLVINRHSKVNCFVWQPVGIVYSDATVVVASDDPSLFSILNSSIHGAWAWKYGSTMGSSTLRYTPSKIFDTFPFPELSGPNLGARLELLAQQYDALRRSLMQQLQLGMTKVYNLFHMPQLSPEMLTRDSKVADLRAQSAFADLVRFRFLHAEMDSAVLGAYGWHETSRDGSAIMLKHDFYEADYLPEDDRLRYTICPEARRELLGRLLALNHLRAEAEKAAGGTNKPKRGKKAQAPADDHVEMFTEED